jgi:hypothetical protein
LNLGQSFPFESQIWAVQGIYAINENPKSHRFK